MNLCLVLITPCFPGACSKAIEAIRQKIAQKKLEAAELLVISRVVVWKRAPISGFESPWMI